MVTCLSPNGSTTYRGGELPDRLLVATLEGIVAAARDGDRFEVVSRSLSDRHVSSLWFEPSERAVFAASYDGGVFVSHDLGSSFESLGGPLEGANVYTVAARARPDGTVLYAGTEPVGLYRSRDGGASWAELPAIAAMPNRERWTFPGPPHVAHLKCFTFDDADPDVLYASVEQGGLFKSVDGGETFVELEGIDQDDDDWYRDVHRVLLHPRAPGALFLTGGDGVSASDDGGASWRRVLPTSFTIGYPDGLVVNPLEPRTMFISGARHQPGTWRETANADAHIARSRDAGATWEIVDRGLPSPLRANIEALSLSAAPGRVELFAGTTGGEVYASSDGGEHFSRVLEGLAAISKGGHYRALVGV